MALPDVIERVDRRLAEGINGAAGWFAITRCHLDAATLQDCLKYLVDIGGDESFVTLSTENYRALGYIVGNRSSDPRIGLNRHQLLALYKPLQLVERDNPERVSPLQVTRRGHAVASAGRPEVQLEEQLRRIIFCRAPYYTNDRVAEYRAFNVHMYPTTLSIVRRVGGWIDRDEFDLFVSRVRTDSEVSWAINGIRQFRGLSVGDRSTVLQRVPLRGPLPPKVYQNWRDMGLHTFSLFALGTSVVRIGDRLLLSHVVARTESLPAPQSPAAVARAETSATPMLRIPEPPTVGPVGLAPPPPVINAGRGSEVFVGKLMAATGWRIVYYGHRRGYGFDIWARKGNSVLYVEVKSTIAAASTISFTPIEMQAAREYGGNFLLVIVEHADTMRQICWSILNPAARLNIRERRTENHVVPARQWRPLATRMELRHKMGRIAP
jgi:hypothetical protein